MKSNRRYGVPPPGGAASRWCGSRWCGQRRARPAGGAASHRAPQARLTGQPPPPALTRGRRARARSAAWAAALPGAVSRAAAAPLRCSSRPSRRMRRCSSPISQPAAHGVDGLAAVRAVPSLGRHRVGDRGGKVLVGAAAPGQQEHEADLGGGGLGPARGNHGRHHGRPHCRGARGGQVFPRGCQIQAPSLAADGAEFADDGPQRPRLDDVGFGPRPAAHGQPAEPLTALGDHSASQGVTLCEWDFTIVRRPCAAAS